MSSTAVVASSKPNQNTLSFEVIKQYPGPQQVTRCVRVLVPGKHFPNLTPAEQFAFYPGTAVQHAERHAFARHVKAWGAAHTGPGIRFICESDAIDDPNHGGFWTTLALWNRWRHDTYKNDREAEKQYFDCDCPSGSVCALSALALRSCPSAQVTVMPLWTERGIMVECPVSQPLEIFKCCIESHLSHLHLPHLCGATQIDASCLTQAPCTCT